ncbi:interleukin-7 receptor subunit alpha [Mixophyes fleayi]|uniref:interleukin-7 receptor subunit alpha n=1 Tax=Mixophyes fleayi TaxID=3061075 RepID=UPI003F4DDCDE
MHISALGIIFLLVHASMEQSGDSNETHIDEETEGEVGMEFQCFTKLRIGDIKVFCNTNIPSENRSDILFKFRKNEKSPWVTQKENGTFTVNSGLPTVNICMWKLRSYSACKEYNIFKNAIPEPPENLFINYNYNSEEYIFDIKSAYTGHEYLTDKLIHEVVLRDEAEEWPDCEEQKHETGIPKVCFKTSNDLWVSKRNLNYSTKYEARVRSKPGGNFFDGPWSAWSRTVHFETETEIKTTVEPVTEESEGDLFVIILSTTIVLFLVTIAILLTVFWKRSIKPLVWPEIPDHKSTLEKLCKKPKKDLHISFNPDYFENMPIHKVDYMKAVVRTEDNVQFSTTDIHIEKPIDADDGNNTPSPAEGSRRDFTTTTIHTEQCGDLSNHANASETLGDNTLENAVNSVNDALTSSANVPDNCTPSNDSCPVMSGPGTGPMCSATVKQSNNGLKVLCWEDIYIAMSAFKTPSTAVK